MIPQIFPKLSWLLAMEVEFPLYRKEQSSILLKANDSKDLVKKCCKLICNAMQNVFAGKQNDDV